jgi:FkbM family methyltransferase
MARSRLKKLSTDLSAMHRMLGVSALLRYVWALARSAPTILREGNMMSADRRMDRGLFKVRHPAATVTLPGTTFSGIREIYLRDVYGMADTLCVRDGGLVVDLGSNVGNFTALALASNSTARAICVEANKEFATPFAATMQLNKVSDRARLCRAFIGSEGEIQRSVAADPRYQGAEWIEEEVFLNRFDITEIDLLKVDIEGSEFAFLDPSSRLFEISRQIAVEIHGFAGNAKAFLAALKAKGFNILNVDWDDDSCIALARREAI